MTQRLHLIQETLEFRVSPCICACRWGPAPSPRGWSKPQASWSSSSDKWLRRAAPAPPARSSDSVHQKCLLVHQWTAGALLPSVHSKLYRSGERKVLLEEGWLEVWQGEQSKGMSYSAHWDKWGPKRSIFTIPSFILDIKHNRGKGRCAGAFWYGWVIEVTQLGVALPIRVPHILAKHHIWPSNRRYTLTPSPAAHQQLQDCSDIAALVFHNQSLVLPSHPSRRLGW